MSKAQWTLDLSESLYNAVFGITNDILQPGQSYRKMYGTEPRYKEILVITDTIRMTKRKTYPDITNKSHHATKDKCGTDQHAAQHIYSSVIQYDTGTIVKSNPRCLFSLTTLWLLFYKFIITRFLI